MIVTIPDPPSLPEIPLEITVPRLNVTVPEAHIDWAYQRYAGVLLNVIESQLEGVPGELDNIWAIWEGEQVRLWEDSFDLVTRMGYVNVLAPFKAKELSYQRSLYTRARLVLSDAIRTKNLQLYITTRLDIEKQRQAQYAEQKGLELAYAKAVVATAVERYNVARQYFAAQVAEAEARQKKISVEMEQNALLIELYQQLVEIERTKVAVNKNIVEVRRAEVRIQQALYEVASAELEIQRVALKIEAVNIEIARLQIQALIVGIQTVSEAANQADLRADIALIGAQSDELRVYQAELASLTEQLTVLREIARTKLDAFRRFVTEKTDLLSQLEQAQSHELSAEQGYINAQVSAAETQVQVEEVGAATQINEIDARLDAALSDIQADREASIIRDRLRAYKEGKELEIMIERYKAETTEEEGQKKAAEILKEAHIVNIFTEYREQ